MADNISVTTGSGIAIGGDLIASVLYQRVKLIAGIDGVNDGDIAATNPLPVSVSGGTIGLNGSVGAVSLTAANFNVVVSNGTIVVNTASTLATSPTAANFNVVVSNGTITVNTISTTAVTQATAANLNVVVSNGTILVNTCSTLATSPTAANFNVVVSNGSIVVNTISTTALVVSQATLALRPTKFRGSLNASVATTAVTVIDGAATNANLHITAYLISASAAGTFWLEDGAGTALTPYHYFAANGGASFLASPSEPISTIITATTIKLKGSAAGSVGCLVLGFSA